MFPPPSIKLPVCSNNNPKHTTSKYVQFRAFYGSLEYSDVTCIEYKQTSVKLRTNLCSHQVQHMDKIVILL